MNMKKLFYVMLIVILFTGYSKAEKKVIIELQIGNEILTNIDFKNEQNYLIALNNNLKNIPKNQLKQLAKESLIREKIKKNELIKYFDFNESDKYIEQILNDFYKKLNFENEKEFINYLSNYNLKISDIREKLKIETLWNELIYKKFINQIQIDKKEIRKKIEKQKNSVIEYNLSEILFELKSNENLTDKYNLILENINNSGFENSANIFSISDSSKFGGKIGWVDQTQLHEKMLNQIKIIDIGKLTGPIQTNGGYLLIKLNNKREKKLKIDLDNAIKKRIIEEKNRQLNQFSLIYYNKIKQNTFISEK